MKTINTLLLISLLSLSAFQCEDATKAKCEQDLWLEEQLQMMKANEGSQKQLIERYIYKGQVVYLMNTCVDCADSMSTLHDCDGNELCKFGGIAGFNTCPDFEERAIKLEVIYSS